MSYPMVSNAADLLAERRLTPDQVWDAAEARLDRPITDGLNIAHEVSDRWARDRARLALIVHHPDGCSQRWTFADLTQASCRLANALTAAGCRPGDRIAAVLGRQVEAWICALAAWRAGMIYMPLFGGFGETALAERLSAAEPAALVVDAQFRDTVDRARNLLAHDPVVYTVGGGPSDEDSRDLWSTIEAAPAQFTTAPTSASDLCTLLFTSGTTGAAKGCEMPHGLVVAVQPFVRHTYGLTTDDMLFSAADPGWGYGLITTGVSVMALGLPRVITPGRFDAGAWLDLFARERATYLASAPSAFRSLVRVARERGGLPPSIRGATCAGEPLDAPLAASWTALAESPLQDGYGSTEAAMVLANLAYDERAPVPGALSSVVPGHEVRLVDDDGNDSGDEGIIAIRRARYTSTTGYWNEPEKWAARFRGEWQLSGDRAHRDADGRWWVLGRADDLIVSSGYNIGPSEVENIVLALPGVDDVGVVAAPHPDKGSVVRAVVVARPGAEQEALSASIKDTVRSKLGRHAYPRIIEFTAELPRTETGKLKRAALRQATP